MGGRGTSSSGGVGAGARRIGGSPQRSTGGHELSGGAKADAEKAGVKLTDAEAATIDAAIEAYTSGSFGRIRAAQVGATDDPEALAKANAIEKYLTFAPQFDATQSQVNLAGDMPKGTYLMRGMQFDDDYARDAFLDSATVGSTISMGGLSSWTSSKATAMKFSGSLDDDGGVVFNLVTAPVKGTSVAKFSRLSREQEVLMSGKASFKVLSTREGQLGSAQVTFVDLAEMP